MKSRGIDTELVVGVDENVGERCRGVADVLAARQQVKELGDRRLIAVRF